ncbi:MAG: hypothetical protein BWY91_02683 [bacterium ADurb.BinA028]|nr:MAG: hypothetical protein BWY91_02683 [bacterium ADurb.BinA028]
MVGVTGLAHGEQHGVGRLAVLDQLGALGDHLFEGLGRVGREGRVADDADVLDGVGDAVDLAVELRGGHGLGRELGLVGRREVDRLDGLVLDQLTEPVVGADDDVRALARVGGVLEVLADVGGHLDGDLDALLGAEGRGVLVDDGLAVLVAPDDEVNGGVADGGPRRCGGGGGRGRCLGGRSRGRARSGPSGPATGAEDQGGQAGEGCRSIDAHVHGLSFEAGRPGGRPHPNDTRSL